MADPFRRLWVSRAAIVLLMVTSAHGYEFAGGSGTPDDPFTIAEPNHLICIGSTPSLLDKHFELIADIDMSGREFEGAVIGGSVAFAGTFDGGNHTISHLNATLFQTVGGEVHNLRIEDADIQAGTSQVGILAGENRGTIQNCHVTGRVSMSGHQRIPVGETTCSAGGLVGTNSNRGTVTECHAAVEVTGPENVGGLVGDNAGVIADSHAEGSVTGHRCSRYVGGLVGRNGPGERHGQGSILRCWAAGDVTIGDDSRSVGGLVGDNTGLVSLSHASGTVQASYNDPGSLYFNSSSDAGGLIGFNAGDVTHCYATGPVSGYSNLGGLVGYNAGLTLDWSNEHTIGRVRDSYATGKVVSWSLPGIGEPWAAPVYVGGLIGRNLGELRNGYFLSPNDDQDSDNGWGTPLNDIQMRQQDSFIGWDFYGRDDDGPADHWFGPEGEYPVLSWQSEVTGLTEIPDVVRKPTDQAWAALDNAGFARGEATDADYDRTVPKGHVLFANPRSYAPAGDTIDLLLSQGRYDWSTNPGDGTPALPYLIESGGQLDCLSEQGAPLDTHFALADDIDMAHRRYAGALIAPEAPFIGRFDGRGHCIRNFVIVSGLRYSPVGLFGWVGAEAEIRGLSLRGVRIECDRDTERVGLLAGGCGGTVVDCHVAGQIAEGVSVGGLIGRATGGRVARCSATVSIDSRSRVGGLIGVNGANVENSYAAVEILTFELAGGLVGQNYGVVTNCYCSGYINGYANIAGLVGTNWAEVTYYGGRGRASSSTVSGYIRNCYTTVLVMGRDIAGGLVAQSADEDIANSYYVVPQQDAAADNGLGEPVTLAQMQDRQSFVGWDFYGSDADGIEDHWTLPDGNTPVLSWQTESSGVTTVLDLYGLPLEEARRQIESRGLTFGEVLDHDYFPVPQGCVGLARARVAAPYVPLGSTIDVVLSLGEYDWTLNPGDGLPEDPYQISTAGQLESVGRHPDLWESCFILLNDIDLVGRKYSRALIAADLRDSDSGYEGTAFAGSLDGGGHTIAHLTIDPTGPAGYLGLFGQVAETGDIRNLRLTAVTIESRTSYAGALVGENFGTVTHCAAEGYIGGTTFVGGLVGGNEGQIIACTAAGVVVGDESSREVGGLIGRNAGTITNCYAEGHVSGTTFVGGLVGANRGEIAACTAAGVVVGEESSWGVGGLVGRHAGTMTNCYATADVTATEGAGGLVGVNSWCSRPGGCYNGRIENCYAAGTVTGDPFSCGPLVGVVGWTADPNTVVGSYYPSDVTLEGPVETPGSPLTEAQMKQSDQFLGWDFDNIWTICEGLDYPRLWWEDQPCPEQ